MHLLWGRRPDPAASHPGSYIKLRFADLHPTKQPNWVFQANEGFKANYYEKPFVNIGFIGSMHNYLMTILFAGLYFGGLALAYTEASRLASFTNTIETKEMFPGHS